MTMAKRKICFRAFQIYNTFLLYTNLTAKNQPETTTKSDKQLPGTIPVNQKLTRQYEFFHIK